MPLDTALGTERPIGTIHELRQLGRRLSDYGSCSRPGDGGGIPGNKGCAKFDTCEFRMYRDGEPTPDGRQLRDEVTDDERIEGVGHGPGRIGMYRHVGNNGAIQGIEMACHEWYTGGNAEIAANALKNKTGDAFSPFLFEGEEVDIRVRGHDLQDGEKCDDCRRGKCTIMEDIVKTVTIPRHKSAAAELRSVVWGNEIEQKMREKMRAAMTAPRPFAKEPEAPGDTPFVLGESPLRKPAGGGAGVARLREKVATSTTGDKA